MNHHVRNKSEFKEKMILKIETYNGKFDNEIISLILSIQNDEAKRILVSNDEIRFAENGSLMNRIRYNKEWWNGTKSKH